MERLRKKGRRREKVDRKRKNDRRKKYRKKVTEKRFMYMYSIWVTCERLGSWVKGVGGMGEEGGEVGGGEEGGRGEGGGGN